MDAAKRERSTAKRLLTLAINRTRKAIDEELSLDIIQTRFSETSKRWIEMIDKNEKYLELAFPEDDISEEENQWLESVTDSYDKIEMDVDAVIKARVSIIDQKEKKHLPDKSVIRTCKFKEKILLALMNNLCKVIKDESMTVEIIKEVQDEMKSQFQLYKKAHRDLATLLDEVPPDEVKGLEKMQAEYTNLNIEVAKVTGQKLEVSNNKSKIKPTQLKLEPIKMPTFAGNIREYPQFKSDFLKQVIPTIESEESLSYILKSCLSSEPLAIVKNVDDDLKEMWRRLDDRFGRASKLTDAIMFDIRQLRPVNDGEERRFSNMVNLIERSYKDLERIDMQAEISNSTVVAMIEEKMPKAVKLQWCLQVCDDNSDVDDRNKFPQLLEFLLKQKRAMEYGSSDLRTIGSNRQGQVNINQGNVNRLGLNRENCWLHKEDTSVTSHPIWKCREFISKSVRERMKLVVENNACQACLLLECPGVTSSEKCKSRFTCREAGCGKHHNRLLHTDETDISGSVNHTLDERNQQFGPTGAVLQMQTL